MRLRVIEKQLFRILKTTEDKIGLIKTAIKTIFVFIIYIWILMVNQKLKQVKSRMSARVLKTFSRQFLVACIFKITAVSPYKMNAFTRKILFISSRHRLMSLYILKT